MKYLQLLLLVMLSSQIMSQQNENQNKGNLSFYFETTQFKYFQDNEQSYFQVFFYMPRNILKFIKADSFYNAKFSVDVKLSDLQDTTNIASKQWTTTINDNISEKDTIADVPVLFESNFAIKPSKYKLSIRIKDLNDSIRWGFQQAILEIPSYKSKELQVSDIQFSTQISKSDKTEELFLKNGYVVVPNPSKVFGSNLPRMFLYAEIYNLQYPSKEGYLAEFIITDEQGSVIKEMPTKNFKKSGESSVIMHSLNIISLSTGRYFLVLRIKDLNNQTVSQSKKMFIVYHEGESLSNITDFDSFFKDLDLVSVELAENVIFYLMNDQERKTIKQLDLEGKKKFFDRFWKDRDPSPGTKTNENLIEYYKRFSEANQRFSSPNRQGWRTDMGRVLMIYGPPGQIEKHEFETKVFPYQRWYYYQLKDQPTQTEFIFANKDGTGIYQLIHSNARSEIFNRNWEKEIESFTIDK